MDTAVVAPVAATVNLPNTRAQDREHVRVDIAEGVVDAEKAQLEEAINPGREEPLTEFELENVVRGGTVSVPRELIGQQWIRDLADGR